MAAVYAYGQPSVQEWANQGFEWLSKDFWARQQPWKESLVGAALTFVLAGMAEAMGRSRFILFTFIRGCNRLFGRVTAVVFFTLLVILPSGIASMTRPEVKEGTPNVLLICLDTWRADHCNFLGYERETMPGLTELGREGVVFENAIAQAPWTLPSVATLFTSLIPSLHGARSHQPNNEDPNVRWVVLSEQMMTLTEVLREAGFETSAYSRNLNIAPWGGFGSGFASFQVYFGDDGRTDVQVRDARKWLDQWDGDRPFFLYMHILDPHYPYEAPAPFGGMYDKSGLDFQLTPPVVEGWFAGEIDIEPAELTRVIDAYDEELSYTDHHLVPFLKEVREKYPDTWIVLYGDHGDEFLEHGENAKGEFGLLGHGHSLYDELVHVPLLIWGPDLEPARIPTQVRLMDVFPTMLDILNLEEILDFNHLMGQSLMPVIIGEETADRLAPMETGGDGRPPMHYRGLRTGKWKLIRREEDSLNSEPFLMLFDLQADPGELKDLGEQDMKQAGSLYRTLVEKGWYFESDDPKLPQGKANPSRLGAAVKGGLKELGYVDDDDS